MEGTTEDLIKNCKNKVKISIIPHYTLLDHSTALDRILNGDQFQKEDCEINSFMSGLNVS